MLFPSAQTRNEDCREINLSLYIMLLAWAPYLACGTLGSCLGQILVRKYYERKIFMPIVEFNDPGAPLLEEFYNEHEYYRA